MKMWIIYKNGIGFSRMIAEMLQDRLGEIIDVDVGDAKKIDPASLLEEKLDYLIIGDVISKEIPSLEIQNWLLEYWELSKNSHLVIKIISGFYIAEANIKIEPFWVEFLQDNIPAEMIYPPILRLALNMANASMENGTLELIKDYSNDFLDFILNNKKKGGKKRWK